MPEGPSFSSTPQSRMPFSSLGGCQEASSLSSTPQSRMQFSSLGVCREAPSPFLKAPIPNAAFFPWWAPPPSFLFPFRAFRVFRCCSSASKAPGISTLYSLLSTLYSLRCVQYIICSRAKLCRVKNILQLFCEKTCTVRKIAVPLHPQNERGPCEGMPEWRPPEVFCARPSGRAAFFDRLTRDECSTGKDKKRTVIL